MNIHLPKNQLIRKLYLLWHSLMSKWMIIILLAVIPLNVFAILTVGSLESRYREQIQMSLKNSLHVFSVQVDYYNSSLQTRFVNDVIVDNMYALANGNRTDSILTDIRLKNQISSLDYDPYTFAACYLYDRERDLLTFFNIRSSITEEMSSVIRRVIEGDKVLGEYLPVVSGDQHYLIRVYRYPYFSFGYLVDTDLLLTICYESCGSLPGELAFMDAEGTVITSYRTEKASTGGKPGIEESITVTGSGHRIVYRISQRDIRKQMPAVLNIFRVIALLSILVIPALYLLSRRLVIKPLYGLAEAMERVEEGELTYRLTEKYGSYQMNFIAMSFNHMVGEIRHMRIASYEQEIGKLQTETINAHLQVNQHMLLNSLNVVYSLILTKRMEEAADFTALLMKYFQYTMRKNSPIVTISEEMDFIEDYLRLQKIRFKNRFTSVCAVAEDAETLEIPQLLVEGFVENAIKYALKPDEMIEILINVRAEDGRLLIAVSDTGAGISEDRLEKIREGSPIEDMTGRHNGFWNVRKRLDYYYGEDYELNITSAGNEGTQIFLNLPEHPQEKEELVKFLREKENT